MKKYIIILLATWLSFPAIGQSISVDTTTFYEKYLFTSDADSAKILLDQLVKETKTNYTYAGTAIPKTPHDLYTVVGYVADESDVNDVPYQLFLQSIGKYDKNKYKSKKALLFNYDVYNVADAKQVYVFKSVQGKYTELFPIWKKYFNPNAEQDSINNFRPDYFYYQRKNGKYSQFALTNMAGGWAIVMKLSATKPDN